MASRIFRKVSLDRLSSPEQLDQLVSVTTPLGWVSLLGFLILLSTVVIWGFFGKISSMASGGGILIKTGGIINVAAHVRGQISNIYVAEGESIRKGQIVARVEQPVLLDEIRAERLALRELRIREKQIAEFGSENLRLQVATILKEKQNYQGSITHHQERLRWLDEKVEIQEKLLADGLITKQTLVDTKSDRESVTRSIEQDRAELKKLVARERQLIQQKERELLTSQQSISEAKRKLELKEAKLSLSSRIVSSYTGNVVEVRAAEGQIISPGSPILSLELTGRGIQDLQALLYLPPDQGKKIKPGMLVHVKPLTVKPEEHGFMLGIVTQVAEFPSSSQGMMRLLENQALVDQFSGAGAPIALFADLIPDAGTASGYKWSSSEGPPFKIFSGTLCSGSVEVDSQPPISLVIPLFKKQFGLD